MLARRRQVLVRRALVLGVLPTHGIDLLAKIGLAVKKPHRHQSQAQVRRRLDMVAGQHPETAAVDRQRLVNTEFRRQVGHWPHAQGSSLGLRPGVGVGRQIGVELTVHPVGASAEGRILGQFAHAFGAQALHYLERVVLGGAKPLRIEIAEQLDDGWVPSPPHVHREFVQLVKQLFFGRHGAGSLSQTRHGTNSEI